MSDQDDELARVCYQIAELVDRSRWQHARTLLADALPRWPQCVELQFLSAHVHWRTEKLDDAVRDLERVLASEPSHYMARIVRADIHETRDELADSERIYLGLIADYPEEAGVYGCYAQLMLRTGFTHKAEALVAECLRLDPDNAAGLQVSTLVSIVRGDSELRDDRLAQMIQRYPQLLGTSGLLFQVLLRDGRYDEAHRVAQQMLRAAPDDPDVVDRVVSARRMAHWSMWPMRPFMRYGWAASAAAWLVAVVLVKVVGGVIGMVAGLLFLLFFVYSWIWPIVLKYWLAK